MRTTTYAPPPHFFSELRILKDLAVEIVELRILKGLRAKRPFHTQGKRVARDPSKLGVNEWRENFRTTEVTGGS